MTRVLRALAVAALLAAMATATPLGAGKQTDKAVEYRLPGDVEPREYRLSIVPFLDDLPDKLNTFQGTVSILVEAVRATSSITLHSNGLAFVAADTAVLDVANGNASLGVAGPLELDPDTQFVVVRLLTPLVAGAAYDLRLGFSGLLNLEMDGFYRSSYVEGGVTKWIATTQMEPSDARKAFPCFDEPALKAVFYVRVGRKVTEVALANMPLAGEPSAPDADIGGRVWDTFLPTPPMSSYLVAFIVSEFTSLQAAEGRFNMWARQEAVAQAQYALDIGPALLANLEEFVGVPCGVPKVDNVAISDFSAGAMENWGLVTYREASLLFDEAVSTEANRQRVATVLAHEFAHFFFGDLVTLSWWEWTWLNEGFARYFQVISVDLLYPEWKIMDQFLVDTVQPIMRTDSLVTTPPLSQECSTPAQCNANFGTITYNKGGSILRMLDHVLTRPTFQKGLRQYVLKFQHQAVTPTQLFAELDAAAAEDGTLDAGVTVEKVMESWTLKPGHPYILVSGLTDDKSTLVISQERVLLRPDPAAPDASLWWVPLTWTRQADPSAFQNTKPMAWLREEKSILLTTDLGAEEWVIFNNRQTGFYRVAYDSHYWPLILAALRNETEFPKIDELNRAQIVDDALSLARSGVVGYAQALEATVYLAQEVAYGPWLAAFNGFDFLESRLVTASGFWAFKGYVLSSMARLYADLTFDAPAAEEAQTRVLGRVNALRWACRYRLPDCVDHALAEFAAFHAAPTTSRVSPNKKSVVYCTALRDGPTAYWDFLWGQYQATNLAAEQVTILAALGCTEDKAVLNNYLLASVSDVSGIRRQDAPSVFTAVYNNPEGVDTALDFLIDNLPEINSHYLGSNTLGNAITGLAGKLTTQAQVDKLKQFATDNGELLGTTSALAAAGKAIEGAEADLEWAAANAAAILDWMAARSGNAAPRMRATSLLLAALVLAAHARWSSST